MKKKCIFHVPNYIDITGKSGSSVRPREMLNALKEKEYEVEYIWGYAAERKQRISMIKDKIESGEKFEFLYSESSTMPTLLTEKHHLPLYPFLDFSFFAYCKKKGISIGLFYRDVYWKFPIYKKNVAFVKRAFAIAMYKYDLRKYKKLVDILYLPSSRMRHYVKVVEEYYELPPGCNIRNSYLEKTKYKYQREPDQPIELFYVGAVTGIYDLTGLLQTVDSLGFVKFTICCRKDEWDERKLYYGKYLNDRVKIVHKSGNELMQYYEKADICMLFFESDGYRSFAMPIKLFEYLSYLTPIIATNGTAAGEFVEKNDIGWSIEYNIGELQNLLSSIRDNPKSLEEKYNNMASVLMNNTWNRRVEKVIDDLSK